MIALLCPVLAVAQQTPCQESAKPILEEVRMSIQNGDTKGKEAAQRYVETVGKCDAAIIESARLAANIESTTQFAAQAARQAEGQEK